MDTEKVMFKVDDPVLVKVRGHPMWPGKISSVVETSESNIKKYDVTFFGSDDMSICNADQIFQYEPDKLPSVETLSKASYKKAMNAFKKYLIQHEQLDAEKVSDDESSNSNDENEDNSESSDNYESSVADSDDDEKFDENSTLKRKALAETSNVAGRKKKRENQVVASGSAVDAFEAGPSQVSKNQDTVKPTTRKGRVITKPRFLNV